MSVENKGIYARGTLNPFQLGRNLSTLKVQVGVNDELLNDAEPRMGVFEQVKVGIPSRGKDGLQWKEVKLNYEGAGLWGYHGTQVDYHGAELRNVNSALLKQHGFYVKVQNPEGNVVVWGQNPGENTKPTVR